MTSFVYTALCFILYSILGWLCETIYCSVPAGKYINRGFLKGPYCPIYGVGAFIVLFSVEPFRESPFLVFLVSMVTATVLEYFASWILEKVFQVRWWDYSDKKFQLNGRIRLKNSLLFGVLGLVLIYGLQPQVVKVIVIMEQSGMRVIVNALLAIFLFDLISSLNHHLGFTQSLQRLQNDLLDLRAHNEIYTWYDSKDLEGSLLRLRQVLDRENTVGNEIPGSTRDQAAAQIDLQNNELLLKLESVIEKRKERDRMLAGYRGARALKLEEALESVKENWEREKAKRKEGKKPSLWINSKELASKTLKAGKGSVQSVAGSLKAYDLFWVFVTAGVLGYLVETLYCLLRNGVIESRQGMLYGPFSQVYAIGAVLMVIFLTSLSRKNDRWVFFGSALLGGAFEFAVSWAQEQVFGSVSWHYGDHAFAIAGGRTSLTYMFFWGILGLFFMKGVYPKLMKFIGRIPKKQGKVIAAILAVTLLFDAAISICAVDRWSKRMQGIAGKNQFEYFLDEQYPDSFMEEVYPNMNWTFLKVADQ